MHPRNAAPALRSPTTLTRREALQAGALATFGLALPAFAAVQTRPARSCIMLLLVGGPGQLDTWDPKPDAPAEVRGPFRAIPTRAPGVRISELFPRMARLADRFSLVRTVHHDAAPIHDTGHQLLQTGRLFSGGVEYPHAGAVAQFLLGERGRAPAHLMLPRPIGATGGNLPHGQTAGCLGEQYEPRVVDGDADASDADPAVRAALDLRGEPMAALECYGRSRFGRSCLRARRLIERGVRFVTVNMGETVFDEVTWDAHGVRPFSTLGDLRDTIAPQFDRAWSALVTDLHDRGLLDETLVVSLGEFGRTPRINPFGGRDHWPHCWTIHLAGGGVQGGRVVGESDADGAFPRERPVHAAEVTATIYHALGIRLDARLPGPDGTAFPVTPAGTRPIRELF